MLSNVITIVMIVLMIVKFVSVRVILIDAVYYEVKKLM